MVVDSRERLLLHRVRDMNISLVLPSFLAYQHYMRNTRKSDYWEEWLGSDPVTFHISPFELSLSPTAGLVEPHTFTHFSYTFTLR
jgi:hypothetical protein